MSDQLLAFLQFLDITDKAALEVYADTVTVRDTDLVGLILASRVGSVPIGHIAIHRHYHPRHLELTGENLAALSENEVGPLSPKAKKTVNKIGATFRERRLFNAHFFWLTEYPAAWHLFYFDQRDVQGQHWVEGPHIHLLNHLTHPQIDPEDLLQKLHESERPPRMSGLHVRYLREDPSSSVNRRPKSGT